jgi:hypothetical protein
VGLRDLRRAAWQREGGRCAVTGALLGDVDGDLWQLHHRRPGGMGGTRRPDQDSLPNVIALLARVHNFGAPGLLIEGVDGRSVHGDPAWSMPRGYLLSPSEEDPGAVPLLLRGQRWVFLTPGGGYLPVA